MALMSWQSKALAPGSRVHDQDMGTTTVVMSPWLCQNLPGYLQPQKVLSRHRVLSEIA